MRPPHQCFATFFFAGWKNKEVGKETHLWAHREKKKENYLRQGHWTSSETNLNVKCISEYVSYPLFFISDINNTVRSNCKDLSSPNEYRTNMHLKVTPTFHFTASFSKIALKDIVQELQVFSPTMYVQRFTSY